MTAVFGASIRFLPLPERSFVVSPPAAMAELPTAAEVARAIADGLEERNIAYAIGGAIALGFYAPPRATVDVDVNVFVSPESELDHLLAALAEIGFRADDDPKVVRLRAMEDGQFRGTMLGLRVDVFVPTVPFYATLREHRREVPLLDRPLWIVGPEDLVVLKLMFFRRKDLADVEAVLRDQGPALDRDFIRRTLIALVGEADERMRELSAIERDVDASD